MEDLSEREHEPPQVFAHPSNGKGKARASEQSQPASSAKIDQLLRLLTLTPKTEKSLVFSQFTTFLDRIQAALDEAGIAYCRFDGQMSARQREEVLDAFSVPLSGDRGDCSSESVSPAHLISHPRMSQDASVSPIIRLSRRRIREILNSDSDVSDEEASDDLTARDSDGEDEYSVVGSTTRIGKRKREAKPHSRGTTTFAKSKSTMTGSAVFGRIPAVMLISLKVRRGDNVTAA